MDAQGEPGQKIVKRIKTDVDLLLARQDYALKTLERQQQSFEEHMKETQSYEGLGIATMLYVMRKSLERTFAGEDDGEIALQK